MNLIKISVLIMVFYFNFAISQELEFFFDTENSIDCQRVQEDENKDYVLIGNMYDTSDHYSAYILKLNENFDTTFRMIGNDSEDILFQDFLILPGNEYFVVGTKVLILASIAM
ncbi:MAG: hypothetical protein R2764_24355 [Bacteroidales bacterium]